MQMHFIRWNNREDSIKGIFLKKSLMGLVLFTGICLLGSMYIQRVRTVQSIYTIAANREKKVVVIDAGHGGKDPGKVGVNDVLEKDINLEIAHCLKELLEQNDVVVIMTREEDKDLASEQAKSRKNEDLRARVKLVEESGADVTVSIHQNSYPEEDVDGAQVFYYTGSESGKLLGTCIQKQLKAELADGNHRMAKANKDYYLLKKSVSPTVIVECGFLSNARESELLGTEEYQRKVAYAIHLGILEFINTIEETMEDGNGDKNHSD